MSPETTQVSISEALKIAIGHYNGQRIPQAKSILEQILAAVPNHPSALHLMGMILIQSGQHQRATELIQRAIGTIGDVPGLYADLGEAWRALGNLDQAIGCYQRVIELDSGNPMARAKLACVYEDVGRDEDARTELRAACLIAQDQLPELEKLAVMLERTNQTSGARFVVDQGLALYPDSSILRLLDAKLDRRTGGIETAIEKLEALLQPTSGEDVGAFVRFEAGQAYDRLGDVDKAFSMFSAANMFRAKQAGDIALRKGEAAIQFMYRIANTLSPEWVDSWASAPTRFERMAPVFLVGFPRSGTTLLEQITGSHSGIRTAEEQIFMESLQIMAAKRWGYPRGIAQLGPNDIHAYRKAYFDMADAVAGSNPGQLLLDKFPLNLNKVPLIQRVFPDARFILVLRHPADSILSCFMQDFSINPAMVNFHTLEGGAAMYDAAMSIWKRSVELLPINYHVVKYENLVQDFETEVRQLLEFMGLPWEDSVKEYQKTARKRERINTPSYSQVSEPIYQRSRDRWRRYEKYLAPIQPVIAPWLEYFDYPA